ncbi:MAG: inositol monophosphatase [Lentisphaerae bacterium]|nr:inositol monophosphatase [Lentisphaerota bacterium]
MKDFICSLAKKAGTLAMEYFDGIRPNEVSSKTTTSDLVSTADRMVEKLIIETIREKFPDHGFFGEETGTANSDAEYRWVIDPIDGTQSFVKRHVYFSISIAFQKNNETIAGAVYAPALNQLFYAEKGKGAYMNDAPIHVSSCGELENAACTTGFGYLRTKVKHEGIALFSELVPNLRDIKRCGSAALDLCNVAYGIYDGYWEFDLKLYDVAAGVLIAQEAGAKVCDYRGGTGYPAQGIVAANPVLLPQLLEYTKKY